jgi:DNA-binding MarR family transcriptional regulator
MQREEAARLITEAVTQLFFSAENQAKFHGAADELGLQPPALKALISLEPGESVSMRQLAEQWACDASFVTIVTDGLEAAGYAERRVAPHDRRIKIVELTSAGVDAREWALEMAYGPRAGFDALTPREQVTLARLLTKMSTAQADHDETLLAQPEVRVAARRLAAQRTRQHRGGGGRGGGGHGPAGGGWKEHFEANRQEITRLKEELARMRDEFKAQARGPVGEARADLKAAKDDVKAQVKAAKDDVKAQVSAEVKGLRGDLVDKLKSGRARR